MNHPLKNKSDHTENTLKDPRCLTSRPPSLHIAPIVSLICIPGGCNLSFPPSSSVFPHAHPLLNPISYSLSCSLAPVAQTGGKSRGMLDQSGQVSPAMRAGSGVKNRLRIPCQGLGAAGCLYPASLLRGGPGRGCQDVSLSAC